MPHSLRSPVSGHVFCVQWGNRVSYTVRITAMFFLEGSCMLLMAGFAPVSYWITLGAAHFQHFPVFSRS